jgi:N-hydroxyarylamine O-acetyltransferase
MNIDAYFQRIGYCGSRTATLENLHALTNAHTNAIPFENLDVLLCRPISLSVESIFQKLVVERRGGYCFEQNGLFLAVLTQLGFKATPLSARVRIDRPRNFIPSRTHMFIRVDFGDKSWLTDVGVGGLSLTKAIELNNDEMQTTPHEARRIVREGKLFFHQAKLGKEWSDVCEFTLEEMPPIDQELGNWFTSTHPDSHFKNRLIIARAGEDGTRYTLLNDEFKIRNREGEAQLTKINSSEDLLYILKIHFDLSFPSGTRFGESKLPWPT